MSELPLVESWVLISILNVLRNLFNPVLKRKKTPRNFDYRTFPGTMIDILRKARVVHSWCLVISILPINKCPSILII